MLIHVHVQCLYIHVHVHALVYNEADFHVILQGMCVFGYRAGMVTVDNAAALEDLLGSLPLLATTRIPGLHLGMWLPPAPPGPAARPRC